MEGKDYIISSKEFVLFPDNFTILVMNLHEYTGKGFSDEHVLMILQAYNSLESQHFWLHRPVLLKSLPCILHVLEVDLINMFLWVKQILLSALDQT